MNCAEAQPMLDAYFDSELALSDVLVIERHLSECGACSVALKNLERLREQIAGADLDFAAKADMDRLRASIRRRLKSENSTWWATAWRNPWVAAAVAALVLISVFLPSRMLRTSNQIEQEIVDAHMRALLPGHLVDVPSSDRHTVKPWFQGKLAFSPQVPDLSAEGFILVGGRLDVVGGRQMAALVYQRRNHIINLWFSPEDRADRGPGLSEVAGYQVLRWHSAGMNYWAVSDLNTAELREFGAAIRSH